MHGSTYDSTSRKCIPNKQSEMYSNMYVGIDISGQRYRYLYQPVVGSFLHDSQLLSSDVHFPVLSHCLGAALSDLFLLQIEYGKMMAVSFLIRLQKTNIFLSLSLSLPASSSLL